MRHNKKESGERIIKRLMAGRAVALCTDAGVPGISDPGADLVALCAGRGIPVVCIPRGLPRQLRRLLFRALILTDLFLRVSCRQKLNSGNSALLGFHVRSARLLYMDHLTALKKRFQSFVRLAAAI